MLLQGELARCNFTLAHLAVSLALSLWFAVLFRGSTGDNEVASSIEFTSSSNRYSTFNSCHKWFACTQSVEVSFQLLGCKIILVWRTTESRPGKGLVHDGKKASG